MLARRWFALALLIGSLAGLGFVKAQWLPGHHAHRSRSADPRGAEPWRNGPPSHWRACLLQHGTGLLSRTETFRIP